MLKSTKSLLGPCPFGPTILRQPQQEGHHRKGKQLRSIQTEEPKQQSLEVRFSCPFDLVHTLYADYHYCWITAPWEKQNKILLSTYPGQKTLTYTQNLSSSATLALLQCKAPPPPTQHGDLVKAQALRTRTNALSRFLFEGA